MELSSNVKLHVIVPDTDPFILFGVEIFTSYSRTILTKRFTDISRFQHKLCYFAYTQYSPGRLLIELLPKLPFPQLSLLTLSESAIAERKVEVEKYFKSLCALYNSQSKNQALPWVVMIRTFLNISEIEKKEKKAARVIQKHFKRYKRYNTIRKQIHEKYMAKGYPAAVDDLTDAILICIFSFLDLKDLFKVTVISKRWNQVSEQPILWTTLNLFQSKMKIESLRFQVICRKALQLRHIDLRYCQFVNSDSLQSISQNCNPDS
jgi:F-box-like